MPIKDPFKKRLVRAYIATIGVWLFVLIVMPTMLGVGTGRVDVFWIGFWTILLISILGGALGFTIIKLLKWVEKGEK